MSKVLVTESYLDSIAEAIRAKNGAATTYRPGDMAAAIQAIPTGGITPTGTKNINQNGTHDVTQYASANVNVQPNLQSKTATENGTVTPDAGYDGLSSVVVDVSGGGGSSEPDLPSEYQRVEYLDFTPSIGILVTIPTTGVVLYTAEFSSDTLGERPAFAYRAGSTNDKDFEIGSDESAIISYLRSPSISRGLTLNDGAGYTVGTKGTVSIILINPRSTALIGKYAHHQSSSVDDIAFDGKIYGVKGINLETNNTTAWFVPCYRKSDNQVGMYDHIAQAFYSETYAVGSGYSIVAGPDMN